LSFRSAAEESVVVFAFAGVVVFAGALAFLVVIPEGNLLLDPNPPRTDGCPILRAFAKRGKQAFPKPRRLSPTFTGRTYVQTGATHKKKDVISTEP
jgi:hypothetical protein